MAISHEQIRDLLLPGLQMVMGSYSTMPAVWESVFTAEVAEIEAALPAVAK